MSHKKGLRKWMSVFAASKIGIVYQCLFQLIIFQIYTGLCILVSGSFKLSVSLRDMQNISILIN